MAAQKEITVQIKADLSQFEKSLSKASQKMSAFGSKMQSAGKKMTTYLTLPLSAAGGVAVANAVKFEKLQTSLEVLTGSAEDGAKAFERLKKFSASTPFQLGDLVSVNNQLMGFGLSTDAAFNSLQMLGDVAAVSGADLSRVAVAFGQSAAAGRVMTQDLNQFINNGIPIYQLLGDVTGKNVAEIRDLASQGKITFDILEEAFKGATSEGGKFYQGTLKLSKTLGGQISTLKDNFAIFSAEFGAIIGEALEPMISATISLFKAFTNLSDGTKKTIVIVAALAAAIGPVVATLGFLATTILPALSAGFAILTSPITLVVAAIAAIGAAVVYIWDNWAAVKERITDISWWQNAAIDIVKLFINVITLAFQGLMEGISWVLQKLGIDIDLNFIKKITGGLDDMKAPTKEFKHEFGSFGDAVKNAGGQALKAMGLVKDETNDTTKAIKGATQAVKAFGSAASSVQLGATDQGTGIQGAAAGGAGTGLDPMTAGFGDDTLQQMDAYSEKLTKIEQTSVAVGDAIGYAFQDMGRSIVDSLIDAESKLSGFKRKLAQTAIDLIAMALSSSIANAIQGATQTGTATGPLAAITTPAFIATAVGGIFSAFAAIPKFATGGIVGGSSFNGDRVLAGVNSGEMILNKGQQTNLFNMLNGGGSMSTSNSGGGTYTIKGQDLVLAVDRAQSTRSRITGRK